MKRLCEFSKENSLCREPLVNRLHSAFNLSGVDLKIPDNPVSSYSTPFATIFAMACAMVKISSIPAPLKPASSHWFFEPGTLPTWGNMSGVTPITVVSNYYYNCTLVRKRADGDVLTSSPHHIMVGLRTLPPKKVISHHRIKVCRGFIIDQSCIINIIPPFLPVSFKCPFCATENDGSIGSWN